VRFARAYGYARTREKPHPQCFAQRPGSDSTADSNLLYDMKNWPVAELPQACSNARAAALGFVPFVQHCSGNKLYRR
jgi:hypothetical protein